MLLPLLAAALLSPAQDASAAAPSEPAAKPEKPQCRRMPASTGSIMPAKPVCHTRAEWAQIDGRNQTANDHLRDSMNNAGRSNY